jgi:hypothetical protein
LKSEIEEISNRVRLSNPPIRRHASLAGLIRARDMSYSESWRRVSAGRTLFLETTKVEQFREITARAEMSTARPLKREKLLIRSFGLGAQRGSANETR